MAKEKLYFEGDTIIACTEFAAKYFGVSAATLSNWAKAGCPKGEYGYWDIKAVEAYRQAQLGVKAAEEAEKDPSKLSLTQQKTYYESQLKQAQLEAAELRNEIARGEYLPRKLVVDDLTNFCIILKRSLNGLGRKLSGEVSHYVDSTEARRLESLIGDTVNDALEQMSVDGVYSAKK